MKKVLIISYYFPPRPGIGSQRPYGLAKYLPSFGWAPIVLTPKLPGKPPDGLEVIQTDYNDIVASIKSVFGLNPERTLHEQLGMVITKNYSHSTLKSKIIKLIREILIFPDEQKGWYKFALKSAIEFLNKNRVDAIISSSYPVTAHLIAQRLKQKFGIPWVADLRDLWTQHHYHDKYCLIKPLAIFEMIIGCQSILNTIGGG